MAAIHNGKYHKAIAILLLASLTVRCARQASAASMVRDKAEAEIQIVQEMGQKRLIDTYSMP